MIKINWWDEVAYPKRDYAIIKAIVIANKKQFSVEGIWEDGFFSILKSKPKMRGD